MSLPIDYEYNSEHNSEHDSNSKNPKFDRKILYATGVAVVSGVKLMDESLLDNAIKENLKYTGVNLAALLMGKIQLSEYGINLYNKVDKSATTHAAQLKKENLEAENLRKVAEQAKKIKNESSKVVEEIET